MARPRKRRKTLLAAVVFSVLLLVTAVALGAVWAMYRAYPFEHRELIEQNAAVYGHDPLFVAAIIRTESRFNAEARSRVGAVGLMQLMPDTARWIAEKNKWEYDEALLVDEGTNIRLGCWYLDYLNRRFDGDELHVLAAYNAGESNVRRWIAEGILDDGTDGIPFAETRSYVQKVISAHEKYQILYRER